MEENKLYTLYTLPNCSHCRDVKKKLDAKGFKYSEVVCGLEEMGMIAKHTDRMSMPVMLDETFKDINYEEIIK